MKELMLNFKSSMLHRFNKIIKLLKASLSRAAYFYKNLKLFRDRLKHVWNYFESQQDIENPICT